MFEEDISLKNKTTLQIGGPAEFFTVVHTEEELVAAVHEAKERRVPVTVLGGGSNVLISDNGVEGLVIKNEITGWQETLQGSEVLLTVGSGEVLDEVIAQTVAKEYWGLENLSHIPGSIGATPIQNVGAYGVEVKDVVESVRVLDTKTMKTETLDNSACQFGYRDSLFKKEEGAKYIVVSVTFSLSTEPRPVVSYKDLKARFGEEMAPDLAAIRQAIIEIRAEKFPDWHTVGTAGSFFKNPIIPSEQYNTLKESYEDIPGFELLNGQVKVPLGWILDHVCNLRGITKGHVGTYKGQALVLVHDGSATATEITEFAHYIVDQVKNKTGITIEWEVTRLGTQL